MAGSPTFFAEGHEPRRTDTNWKVEEKILGALVDGGGGTGGSGNLSGVGDPTGVVTPTAVNQWYFDTTSASAWTSTGLTSADWVLRI